MTYTKENYAAIAKASLKHTFNAEMHAGKTVPRGTRMATQEMGMKKKRMKQIPVSPMSKPMPVTKMPQKMPVRKLLPKQASVGGVARGEPAPGTPSHWKKTKINTTGSWGKRVETLPIFRSKQ